MVSGAGVEPTPTVPKTVVLPLHYPEIKKAVTLNEKITALMLETN